MLPPILQECAGAPPTTVADILAPFVAATGEHGVIVNIQDDRGPGCSAGEARALSGDLTGLCYLTIMVI